MGQPTTIEASGSEQGHNRLSLYRTMARIRLFEEQVGQLYRAGEVPGFVHLSIGQEGVAAGVCSGLINGDIILTNHRGHGHMVARGANLTQMMAELFGRAGGTCRGFAGSMHIADLSLGIYGANGIVGAGLPIAVGVALSSKLKADNDRVVVAFFGDGAVATGEFHEAMNLAALWRLPVIFCCEDNGYSEFSRSDDQQPVPIEQRAAAYGMSAVTVDGNDVEEVRREFTRMRSEVVTVSRPALFVARTLRTRGHYEGDPQRYRDDEHRADPLTVLRDRVTACGGGTAAELHEIEQEAAFEVAGAVDAARRSPWPDAGDLYALGAYPPLPTPSPSIPPVPAEQVRVSQAIRQGLDDALSDDPRTFLLGIDIGAGGNVFGLTRGLLDKYPGRVIDSPISESGVVGAAIGAALDGLRPIVELMYLDFVGVCFDQLLNQAAKVRFMTGGAAQVPLVVRTQYGVGRSSGSQHSQSLEALLAHIPGLLVVMPTTTEDYYGLLRSAVDVDAPVVFIENRLHYERRGVMPARGFRVPIGKARIARRGTDVTVVAASNAVSLALEAAATLQSRGISAEVIDLRSVVPLDMECVLRSLARTNRLVIATEGVGDFGIGAEIASRAADEGLWHLDAPVRRVSGPALPVPYSPALEREWLPSTEKLIHEIEDVCRDR